MGSNLQASSSSGARAVMRVSILNSKTAQRVLRRGTMEVGEELDCEVDDDLTNDVASLRAVLSENVPSTSPGKAWKVISNAELYTCIHN